MAQVDLAPGAWTDERIDTLRALWADGLSAREIADKLGHVTRSAVIGKIHRLGLSGRRLIVKVNQHASVEAGQAPKIEVRKRSTLLANFGASNFIEPRQTPAKPRRRKKLSADKEAAQKAVEKALPETSVPFLDRGRKQCAHIVNDDLENPICCGAKVGSSTYDFCENHMVLNFA